MFERKTTSEGIKISLKWLKYCNSYLTLKIKNKQTYQEPINFGKYEHIVNKN